MIDGCLDDCMLLLWASRDHEGFPTASLAVGDNWNISALCKRLFNRWTQSDFLVIKNSCRLLVFVENPVEHEALGLVIQLNGNKRSVDGHQIARLAPRWFIQLRHVHRPARKHRSNLFIFFLLEKPLGTSIAFFESSLHYSFMILSFFTKEQ